MCVLLSLASFIQAKGTKPPDNFKCHSLDNPKRIDVAVETGSEYFSGTDDAISLLLRDSQGVVCTVADLNNSGNDYETNSIDYYAICCPQDFAEAHDPLSMLLLGHRRGHKGNSDDWFVERIEVRRQGFQLFKYRFHAWTHPYKTVMLGVSRVTSSHSNNGKPSYSLIHL
jgi:hypothetical protein